MNSEQPPVTVRRAAPGGSIPEPARQPSDSREARAEPDARQAATGPADATAGSARVEPGVAGSASVEPGAAGSASVEPGAAGSASVKPGVAGSASVEPGVAGSAGDKPTAVGPLDAKTAGGGTADATPVPGPSADAKPAAGSDPTSTAGTADPKTTAAREAGNDATSTSAGAAERKGAAGIAGASERNGEAAPTPGAGEDAGAAQPAGDADKADPGKSGGDQEPDRWAEFAGRTEPPPSWFARVGTRIGRFLRHEWTVAALVSLAGAVAMTWPTLRYPRHTIPQDIWDPTLQAWQMAWSGHILRTDPGRLWHSNAFYPELWSFAFSDGLLGYAPLGMIGEGPVAAIVRYNIVFVLAHALATFGAYMLARQLGAGRTGGAVAAVGYAYAPWLLSQAGHLHILSNGGIPLALAMLARGHGFSLRHGYRPERRHAGWALAGWLTAAWQLSLGFGIGLVFAYVLALIVVGAAIAWLVKRTRVWKERRPFGRKLFITDLAGGALFAATGGLLAIPYYEVAADHPYARRGVDEIDLYSPPLRGFFTAPAESWLWGDLHKPLRDSLDWAPEMTLLPGFALIGLAFAGLFFSIWTIRQRLLLLAAVVVTTVLAMGTRFFDGTFTYKPLLEYLPGWDGIRTPGRLTLWLTLLLGILAAGSVSAFVNRAKEISANRIPPWPSPWLRIVTLIPLALVVVEGVNQTPHPIVPPQPAAMRTVDGPLLVLPSDQLYDENVMLWSTTKFQDIVNGGSGFTPNRLAEVRTATATFPDVTSINYLRSMGVRTVVVIRDRVPAGSPLQTAIELPVDSLGITREDIENAVVYHL